jgi:hypothetical protein
VNVFRSWSTLLVLNGPRSRNTLPLSNVFRSWSTLLLLLSTGYFVLGTSAHAADPEWVAPMTDVHARFKGTPGTLLFLGDSITNTRAFWSSLQYDRDGMDEPTTETFVLVRARMRSDCWQKWRGPDFGSESGKTTRWANERIDTWLRELNPEAAVVLFGTNDLNTIDAREYETQMRSLLQACLKNGTVPIATTIPPRSGAAQKAKQFAEVVRKLSGELKIPLIDYQAEILKRRPNDWDGRLPQFREFASDVYNAPTLVAADGVHPSNPGKFKNYTEEGLRTNGYVLRNYLTLHGYADVTRRVFEAKK